MRAGLKDGSAGAAPARPQTDTPLRSGQPVLLPLLRQFGFESRTEARQLVIIAMHDVSILKRAEEAEKVNAKGKMMMTMHPVMSRIVITPPKSIAS